MTKSGRPLNGADAPLPAGPVELAAEDLRWSCAPVRASRREPRVSETLGQERPLAAMRAGLAIRAPGHHLFVSGAPGSGRRTLVEHVLAELQPERRPGPDYAYVSVCGDPQRLRLLRLPRGAGDRFAREYETMLWSVRDAMRAALAARPHRMSRQLILRAAEERRDRLMTALGRVAEQNGCAIVQHEENGAFSADVQPVHEGHALGAEAMAALVGDGRLTATQRDGLLRRREAMLERVEEVFDRLRRQTRRTEEELAELDRQHVLRHVGALLDEFRRAWPQPEVDARLAEIRANIERELPRWVLEPSESEGEVVDPGPLHELSAHSVNATDPGDPCPVVFEAHPSYAKLFGALELMREAPWGLARVQEGALLRGDGGFVVMRAVDVFSEPNAWSQLKRTLRSGELELREVDVNAGQGGGVLQADPIPLDVKVVLIGEPGQYEHMVAEDPQFAQLFKVHAEFDASMPADAAGCRRYADQLAWLTRNEGLRAFAGAAAAAVVEFGARQAGRRDRLSTAFGDLADVAREASWYREQRGNGPVQREDVERAVAAREARAELGREHLERDFADGYLRVRTEGEAVGEINALTVLDSGTFAFGRPSRVTVSTGVGSRGRSGLLNIEREAELSGPLHDKGVLILGGYLLRRFAQDAPLCLQASICFEQNYGGVDGDSASGAELVALLSSLAGVALSCAYGMTGAINQAGELQAVSGVNEKIEGFFRLCATRGLRGGQGVVIPAANVLDLMLQQDLVAAVRAGAFRVIAVDTVEQALAVLTGREPEAVLAAAGQRLRAFAEQPGAASSPRG